MFPVSAHNDHHLIQLISQDNEQAFEELWSRYWKLAYNTAYKRLKDEDQCRDIVQDVFTDLWVRRNTLNIENLPAYLSTAVRYKVYKTLARAKVNTHFFDTFEAMLRPAGSADNVIIEKELSKLAQAWLQTLPEKRRKIFKLHYIDNLSTKEIAQQLNISQKTVQNQLGLASDSFYKQVVPVIVLMLQIKTAVS